MRELRSALLVFCAGLALAPAAAAASSPEAALRELLHARVLRGAQVGVVVADLDTGRVLLSRNPDRALVPASNQKLLVAAVALAHWGPAHQFETRILTDGEIGPDGTLEGTLWVVGEGDPSLVSERLWKLAEAIRLKGIRAIRGGIGVDSSYFDSLLVHPDWEPVNSRAYYSRISAFAANYSSFRVEVAGAAKPGQPAIVSVVPRVSYFRVRSDAPTIRREAPVLLELEKLPDGSGERVVVHGAVPFGRESKTYWRAVSLPSRYAVSVLRSQLAAHGVRVSGPVRMGRAPDGAAELLRFKGEPLAGIVQKQNKFSNNFIAEQLTKSLGADVQGPPGRWATGTRVIREYLRDADAIDEGTVIADGSGLSPRNRISPASLVRLIRLAATHFESGPEFLASLPLSRLDGTLEDRMRHTAVPVRGKTGHLRHVASLSGVLRANGGRRLAFSILVNGARGSNEEMDQTIDEFVASLGAAPWTPAQGATGD